MRGKRLRPFPQSRASDLLPVPTMRQALAAALCCLPLLVAAQPDDAREGPGMSAAAHDEAGNLVLVCVAGGHLTSAGVLRGARLAFQWPHDGSAWEGFDRSLDPWLVAGGRFAGGDTLLVGVRKATLFDSVERERPFLYTIRADYQGLRKRWLGTSLARPFATAGFADLRPGGEDELYALERTRDGGWELAAYLWEGFGVEGLARSPGLPPSDTQPALAPLAAPEGHRLMVMTRRGPQATFTAYAFSPGGAAQGPFLAPVARCVATVGSVPFIWAPYSSSTIGIGVTLVRGKALRVMPLQPLGEGLPPSACE